MELDAGLGILRGLGEKAGGERYRLELCNALFDASRRERGGRGGSNARRLGLLREARACVDVGARV